MSVAALILAAALQSAAAGAPPSPPPSSPATSSPVKSGCRMALVADLPVTFRRNRPTVPMQIDGRPVTALVDTGAAVTMIFTDAAERLGLMTRLGPDRRMYGVDGESMVRIAHVTLGIMDAQGKPADMMVAGRTSEPIDMILGEDFLSQTDLELDLGHGKIRMLRARGCADDEMPYWAKSTYSEARFISAAGGHVQIDVMLNGIRVPAILDSGASRSMASRSVALQAGVALPDSSDGRGRGLNGRAFPTRRATVRNLQFGDEKIAAADLEFGDLYERRDAGSSDTRIVGAGDDRMKMLLGADFLRAHHVLISRGLGKIYFTYEGGPVFRPEAPPVGSPAKPLAPPDAAPASEKPAP